MPHLFSQQRPRRGMLARFSGLATLFRYGRAVTEMSQVGQVNTAHEQALAKIAEGKASGVQQAARLGDEREATQLQSGNLYLGTYASEAGDAPLFFGDDKGITVMGGAGTGKTSTVVIPSIIHCGGRCASIINDIKGELSWTTALGRAKLDGREPVFFNPWRMHGWDTAQFNPLDDLVEAARDGRNVIDRAKAKVRMIFGDPQDHGANAWIPEDAMERSELYLIWRAYETPDECTLGSLWDFASASDDEVTDLLLSMAESECADGYVARIAEKVLAAHCDDKQKSQNIWITQTLRKAVDMFGRGSVLRSFTERTTVDLSDIKNKPRALYVMTPDRFAFSHAKFIALLFDSLIETVAFAEGDGEVAFELDEFANLPKMDCMVKALRLYRDRGVRLRFYVQDRDGFKAYDREGGYKVFRENTIGMTWAQKDAQLMKDIEAQAGYDARRISTNSAGAGLLVGTSSVNDQEVLVPVLPVSEIARIAEGKAILEIPGQHTLIINRVPWWQIIPWRPFIRNQLDEPMPAQHF